MRLRRGWMVYALGVLSCAASQSAGVQLSGKIIRVGFPGSTVDPSASGADFYRPGCWTPVFVELTNTDSDLFQGTIETWQPDRDGDEVVSRPATSVSVRGTRTYYLYVPASSHVRDHMFGVRVYGADGRLMTLTTDDGRKVTMLEPVRTVTPLQPPHARVIMDISESPVTHLNRLVRDPHQLVRELCITRLAPSALPDNVAGLEMADTIVWDNADPSMIDPAQLDALIQWTRRGGKLLVTVNRKWELLARSKLGELLPARLSGAATTSAAGELKDALLGGGELFGQTLDHAVVKSTSLAADTVPLIPSRISPETPDTQYYLTQRPCGRGLIILCAATLQDLLSRGTENEIFLRNILCVRRLSREPEQQPMSSHDLFGLFLEPLTSFRLETGLYFLVAFLFVVAYILVATAGSWAWLKRKGLLTWSWTAFAMLAVVASVASLGAVQVIRGTGNSVQQLTVLDANAGVSQASGICYFGLKTATHTVLDLCVPRDWKNPDDPTEISAGLQPLPASPEQMDTSTYVAGQRYDIVPSLGQLRSVPLRATLKQFQGFWEGEMLGRVNASLMLRRADSFRLDGEKSWIQNELDVDLQNCKLFIGTRNAVTDGSEPARSDRSMSIYVYDLGTIHSGEKLNWSKYLDSAAKADADQPPESTDALEIRLARPISVLQDQWLADLRLQSNLNPRFGRDPETAQERRPETVIPASLALSMLTELSQNDLLQKQQDLTRTRGRELDRSALLTRHTAMLIGFSEGSPGPVRLCWRRGGNEGKWRAIEPTESRVIYRIGIPVSAPRDTATEDSEAAEKK